jgi:hypothetical protein
LLFRALNLVAGYSLSTRSPSPFPAVLRDEIVGRSVLVGALDCQWPVLVFEYMFEILIDTWSFVQG